MKVFLVRHTEVDKEATDWIAGKTNVELTQNGVEQAALLAANLTQKISFDHIYSSPLKRCQHLAQQCSQLSQKPIQIDERLSELDFGEWEGKRLSLLYEQNPALDLFSPPGGESVELFSKRVLHFWEEVILNLNAEHVLVVAHGGTNSAILMRLTRSPLDKFWDFMQSYGGVSEIEIKPDGTVASISVEFSNPFF